MKVLRGRLHVALAVSLLASLLATSPVGAVTTVELTTAAPCPVAQRAQWQSFGIPYPCFPSGTQYSVATEAFPEPTLVQLNDVTIGVADGAVLTLPTPRIGLNSLEFVDAATGEVQHTPIHFINYLQRVRLFSFAGTTRKDPHVVTLQSTADAASVFADVAATTNEWLHQAMSDGAGDPVYLVDLDPDQVAALRSHPQVLLVTPERIQSVGAQQNNAPWGLDRIDQETSTLDGIYNYSRTGTDVEVFVVDSGIRTTHSEFAGRLGQGAYLGVLGSVNDCNGHGTHVAGTVGGTTYGVAKNVKIRAVRVFDCFGSSSTSAVIAAINWIKDQHVDTQAAVANFSLGGTLATDLNSSIQSLIDDGVVTVVAAGNESDDACRYSPASAANAITVGAVGTGDVIASYSNTGSCVDIFAPGSDIVSAGIENDADTATASGTSMATPHVAGIAALILQRDFPGYDNKRQANSLVQQTLVTESLKNLITRPGAATWYATTPNRLATTVSLLEQQQQTLTVAANETSTVVGLALPIATAGGSGSGLVTFAVASGDCRVLNNYVSAWVNTNCIVTATKAASVESQTTYAAATSSPETITVGARLDDGTWRQVVVGLNFSCAVSDTKRVYCWGANGDGQLARPIGASANASASVIETGSATAFYPQPMLVTGLVGDVESVTAGRAHACARMSSGKVYCWGKNDFGQLGTESSTSSSTPVEVALPDSATAVSAGGQTTCAITASGALYCWGRNNVGQLGIGTTVDTHTPQAVGSLASVTDLSVGSRHVCAIASGAVTCWGDGTRGALGLGDTATALSPSSVTLPGVAVRVSAGTDDTCARLSTNATYCWGSNTTGALSLGNQTQVETPTRTVGLAETSTAIAVGDGASCWIGTSGNAACSGDNANGVLGTANTTSVSTATAVLGLTSDVVEIAPPSASHTCARVAQGTIYCWGDNSFGQLGTSNTLRWNFISKTSALAIEAALIPTFETATQTSTGFVSRIRNFDSAFTYGLSVVAETSTATVVRNGETLTVTGLLPGETATVSVATSRVGFLSDTATVTGGALLVGLLPILETVTPTADGFTVAITNYDATYAWTATSSHPNGVGTVSNTGIATITGVPPATSSIATVTATRTGYTSRSETATATSLLAARVPQFGAVTRTADGFIVTITNFENTYIWVSTISTSTSGSPTLTSTDETLTVTGLPAGASATITTTTTRAGYASGSAPVTGTAIDPPPAPSPPSGGGSGGGGGAPPPAPIEATAPAAGGGGGSGVQVAQSGQAITIDVTAAPAQVSLQSATAPEVTLTVPKGVVPNGARVVLENAPANTSDPKPVRAVRIVITAASGESLTTFTEPLEIKLGVVETSAVVATSQDGQQWAIIPRLETTTLPAGQRTGYYIDAKGEVVVLTRHLTYFGSRLAQEALTAAPLQPAIVGSTVQLSVSGGSGTGALQFSSRSANVCTVNGNALNALAVGDCLIDVVRNGDRLYVPSTSIALAVQIIPKPKLQPSITITSAAQRRTVRLVLDPSEAGATVRIQTGRYKSGVFTDLVRRRVANNGTLTVVATIASSRYVRVVVNGQILRVVRLR